MKNVITICFLACCCFFNTIYVNKISASQYNLSPPTKKQVIIEEVYEFYTSKYTPPYKIKHLTSKSEAIYDTPESTAIAHLSAILTYDWDWFLSMWTDDAKKRIGSKGKKNKAMSMWKELLSDARAELLERVDRGEYVIIEFRLYSSTEYSKTITKGTVVLKLDKGKWKCTHLRADPVKRNWRLANPEYHEKKNKLRTVRPKI